MECRAEKDCGSIEPKFNIEWASTDSEWSVGRKRIAIGWNHNLI